MLRRGIRGLNPRALASLSGAAPAFGSSIASAVPEAAQAGANAFQAAQSSTRGKVFYRFLCYMLSPWARLLEGRV